jgi:hypothetical protein
MCEKRKMFLILVAKTNVDPIFQDCFLGKIIVESVQNIKYSQILTLHKNSAIHFVYFYSTH